MAVIAEHLEQTFGKTLSIFNLLFHQGVWEEEGSYGTSAQQDSFFLPGLQLCLYSRIESQATGVSVQLRPVSNVLCHRCLSALPGELKQPMKVGIWFTAAP